MNYIKTWNLLSSYNEEELLNYINIECKGTFLLNTKNNFNLLEKIVYDLAMFHFNDLNICYNEDYYIEFWWKNATVDNKLHMDCDEYEKKENNFFYPLRSCVTYFNNNDFPTVITNIDFENYKYKKTPETKEIIFSFPKKNKHIAFDGTKYHGVCNILDIDVTSTRLILAINLWNRKPSYVPFYDNLFFLNSILKYKNIDSMINYKCEPTICSLESNDNKITFLKLSNSLLDNNFYDVALYEKTISLLNEKFPLIKNNIININKDTIKMHFSNIPTQSLVDTYGELINDIYEIVNENVTEINRFSKWYVSEKIYSIDICEWIINESENYAKKNGGWTKNRHLNYPTTDIPIENISNIFNFVLCSLQFIFPKIKTLYDLPEKIIFNVVDIFIVKYDASKQNHLEYHADGSHLSFNILLNNENDFEGGGTKFENNDEIIKLTQGDMLAHCSKKKHCGIEITKGKRYILVFFINLKW